MDKTTLGLRIREARQSKGYSRQLLAEKAGTGEVYLGEIERGLKMPSLNTFIRIVEALDISADYLLRDNLTSGKEYIFDEITQKLQCLTPKQRKTAADILDAYIINLEKNDRRHQIVPPVFSFIFFATPFEQFFIFERKKHYGYNAENFEPPNR